MAEPSPESDVSRPLPAWISLVLIVLCLSGGEWIVHWYVNGDPLSHESRVLDASAAPLPRAVRGRGGPMVQPRNTNGTNGWMVRAPEANMYVVEPKGKPPEIRAVDYNNYVFVPAEERKLIFAARRIARDPTVSKPLKVTPEQIEQLHPLMPQVNMAAAPADLEKLKSAWAQYQSAGDKAAAENKLAAALDDVARKSLDPTLKAAADRAAKIKAVLTAEQWKEFDAMGH
jgi:hypothetical protein